jgi:hypothetical protein
VEAKAVVDTIWVEFMVWPTLPFETRRLFLCDALSIPGRLDVGTIFDLSTQPRTARELEPGVYYVGVIVDPRDAIAEQREDNNFTDLLRKKLYVGARPTTGRHWQLYR